MNYPFSDLTRIRVFAAWNSALVMFGIWLGAQIIAIPFALPFGIYMAQIGGPLPPMVEMAMTMVVLLVVSLAMIVLTLVWSKTKEGRNLADIGIRLDPVGWLQYRKGISIGVLFTIALALLVAILTAGLLQIGMITSEPEITPVWSNLADPTFWLLISALGLLFALQSAAEEVMCRGWLLGALTAKKGLPFAVLVSSLLFASLHIHYFFNDGLNLSANQMLVGIVAIGAMFGMGLMLAMLALRDRSIMGAAGLHAGFNFSAVTLAMVAFQVRPEQSSVAQTFVQSFAQSANLNQMEPALIVQFLLSVLLAYYLYQRFGLPKRHDGGRG
ncbi:hypothetical protein MNBD_ALPHA06-1585 [hydrothermal vent metagenome]|uniref:CAAX prenyl protease 2/Lysostaphin resistance protein A-like domain-containing protein n=1 Tax=hydrothermal vent metagenome TaxID=652676 RepID=A0A3B0SQP0_9ZZZZ